MAAFPDVTYKPLFEAMEDLQMLTSRLLSSRSPLLQMPPVTKVMWESDSGAATGEKGGQDHARSRAREEAGRAHVAAQRRTGPFPFPAHTRPKGTQTAPLPVRALIPEFR